MSVTERIFYELNKQNKSITSLCKHLNIASNVVANWRQKSPSPPSKYLVSICEFLNISADYLLTGQETNMNPIVLELTPSEQELLNNFRLLDLRGQYKVHTLVYDELDRMKNTD